MKKVKEKSKSKRETLALTRKLKLLRRSQRIERRSTNRKDKKNHKKWWTRTVSAPVEMHLNGDANHYEVVTFIQDAFDESYSNQILRIDFKHTNQMRVDALLLFIINLELALQKKRIFKKIKIAPSSNHLVNGVLTQLGALEMCGQDYHINPKEEDGVVDWKYLKGSSLEKLDPKEIFNFLSAALGHAPSKILGNAVNEALLNIKHHAFENKKEGKWWVFTHRNEVTKRVSVVVGDAGIGIPVSISKGTEPNQLKAQNKMILWMKRLKRPLNDSETIRLSMRLGKSRTGQTHRGKGLPAMKELVNSQPDQNAYLNIYSNKGMYTKSSKMDKPNVVEYRGSIGGTVVVWIMPFEIDDRLEQ